MAALYLQDVPMIYRSIFVVLFITMLTACSSGGNDDVSDPLGINGFWLSNCYYDEEFEDYTIDEYTFASYTVVAYFESFYDSSCSGTPYTEGEASGSFSLGETITTSGGVEAVEFNAKATIDNQVIEAFDLIRVDGNTFNWGVSIDGTIRPTAIDFNITYTKQEI
jgi:hypothetical protein